MMMMTDRNDDDNDCDDDDVEGLNDVARQAVIGSALSVIVLLTVVGNLLLCVVVIKDVNLRKNNNFFLVSLAVSDLLVAIVVMIPVLVNDVLGRWLLGPELCNIWMAIVIACCTCSIWNICLISLDRCRILRSPVYYKVWLTERKTAAIISSAWALSALLSAPLVAAGVHTSEIDVDAHGTKVQKPDDRNSTANQSSSARLGACHMKRLDFAYAVGVSAVGFYLPAVIILSNSFYICVLTRRHDSAMRAKFGGSISKHTHSRTTVIVGALSGIFSCVGRRFSLSFKWRPTAARASRRYTCTSSAGSVT
nr:hypothetical protein BaRGS_024010 [Batillaria attramentaria]